LRTRESPSKLDAEENQDLSVFNKFAVIAVRHNEVNNKDEESINEEEDDAEDLTKKIANDSNNFAESDIKETNDGENKPDNFDDKDEEISDNHGEFLKSAAKNDFGFNDQLQVGEDTLEEFNDFPKEGGNETTVNSFGTTFNFDSSSDFNNDHCNIVMALLDTLTARWTAPLGRRVPSK